MLRSLQDFSKGSRGKHIEEMGAKVSREKVENTSAVRIVLAGGTVETYPWPVSAQEVMLCHPRHVVTQPQVFKSDIEKALVLPEAVLMSGHLYYLLSFRTVRRLLERRQESLKKHITNAPIDGDAIKPAMTSPYQQHRPTMAVTMNQPHPVRSPRENARRRLGGRNAKGRAGKSPSRASGGKSPSRAFASKSPSRAFASKSPSRSSAGKSPSRSPKFGEGFQRSRKSNPKVCPGEEGVAGLEEKPNTSKILFGEAMVEEWNPMAEDDHQPSPDQLKSMQGHLLLSQEEEAKPLLMRTNSKLGKEAPKPRVTLGYHLLQLSSSFSADEASDESEDLFKEAPASLVPSTHLLSIHDVSLETSLPMLHMPPPQEEKTFNPPHMISSMEDHLAHELFQKKKEGLTGKDPSSKALSELLKVPDLYEAVMFQEMVDLQSEALSELPKPLHEAENQIKDTLLDVSMDDDIPRGQGLRTNVMVHKDVQVDDQQRELQVCALMETNQEQELQPDNVMDNLPNTPQANGDQERSVPMEDEGQDFSVLPEVEVAELQTIHVNAQQGMQVSGSLEVCRDDLASGGLDAQESMRICGSVEVRCHELASSVSRVLLDMEKGKLQHVNQADNRRKQLSAWLCLDPVSIPVHPSGLMFCGHKSKGKIEHSSKSRLYEDILPQRVTLGDHFSHPSPLDSCMNEPIGDSVGMNQDFSCGLASSSLFLKKGSSHTRRPDQKILVQHARKQPYLFMLGFHPLRTDNPSLIEQLTLHKRAQGVATSSLHHDEVKVSILDEKEMSSRLRQRLQQQQKGGQQSKQKQQTQPPTSPPSKTQRSCPSPSRPALRRVRIRSFRYRRAWQPMPPIMEMSPEITPFSATPSPLGTPQSNMLHTS